MCIIDNNAWTAVHTPTADGLALHQTTRDTTLICSFKRCTAACDQQCTLGWWRHNMGTGFYKLGTGFAAGTVLTSLLAHISCVLSVWTKNHTVAVRNYFQSAVISAQTSKISSQFLAAIWLPTTLLWLIITLCLPSHYKINMMHRFDLRFTSAQYAFSSTVNLTLWKPMKGTHSALDL